MSRLKKRAILYKETDQQINATCRKILILWIFLLTLYVKIIKCKKKGGVLKYLNWNRTWDSDRVALLKIIILPKHTLDIDGIASFFNFPGET